MSIHVSKRTLSRMEYEDQFRELYKFMRMKMSKIPKRRRDSIAAPIFKMMNEAYDLIISIDEDPVRGTKTAAATRYDRIVRAQETIIRVEPHLWTWWNISSEKDAKDVAEQNWKKRANFCGLFNKVLIMLHDMQVKSSKYDPEPDKGVMQMRYFTETEIEKAEFLKKLRELQRMTHGKHIHLSEAVRDAESAVLVKLVDFAWYNAAYGNQLKTYIPEEYTRRRKMFSAAISALNKYERALIDLFGAENYSNREMREWWELLNESIRLLTAVQKSSRPTGD